MGTYVIKEGKLNKCKAHVTKVSNHWMLTSYWTDLAFASEDGKQCILFSDSWCTPTTRQHLAKFLRATVGKYIPMASIPVSNELVTVSNVHGIEVVYVESTMKYMFTRFPNLHNHEDLLKAILGVAFVNVQIDGYHAEVK